MQKAAHCQLCENQIVDYLEGTKCGLTNEIPLFNTTCQDINFGKKAEEKIITTNAKFKELKNANFSIYAYFALFSIIGCFVIFGAYYWSNTIWDRGYISAAPLIIAGVGVLVTSSAIATFVKHRNKFTIAKQKKEKLDTTLALYDLEYNLLLTFGKHYHGITDVKADLEFIKKKKNEYARNS